MGCRDCNQGIVRCCRAGRLVLALPTGPNVVLTITAAMLVNPAIPNTSFRFVAVTGGSPEGNARVVIPKPTSDALDYILGFENLSDGVHVVVATDPATGNTADFGTGDPGATEADFTQAVQNIVAGGPFTNCYRSDVEARPDGAWLSPGYQIVRPPQ